MTEHKPYRVAIWCAVSSKAQASEDKISLQAQEAAGREFAGAIGGHVVAVYTVPGHSRDIIFWQDAEREMEAYRQLREDVEGQRFDVLHAMDPDRLGRDPALSNQLVSLVEKSGAEVYLASNPHVVGQKGAGNRYVFAIQSTRAGEDQQRRVAYQKRGMRARIRRGLHGNNWPYGYSPVRDSSGVISAEFDENAGGVRLATARFLAGDPYSAIVEVLEVSPYRPVRAESWTRCSVLQMLHNDTYAGIVSWSETAAKSTRFPALWDEDTYSAVLRERKRRDGAKGRRRSSPFIHVAYCARCGTPMHRGGLSRRGTQQMMCSRHHQDRNVCHANTTQEGAIQDELIAFLESLLDDTMLDAVLSGAGDDTVRIEAQLLEFEQRIDEVRDRRKRVAMAFASGAMDPAMYREVDDDLLDELARWEQARRDAEDEIATLPDLSQRRSSLAELCDVERLFDLPATEINTLLRDAGIRVECEDRQVVRIRIC
jgi:DNA invertase Pin-like site-specific DNA recombinase